MYILGISAFYHDAAACLLYEGKIIAAAQEERFTRVKHDSSFPVNAIKFCLEFEGVCLEDISEIVFYEKPLLKFERVLENFLHVAPLGLKSFVQYIPLWVKEKLFARKNIHDRLDGIGLGKTKHINLKFCDHHLSHAAWAYLTSPFEEAAIVTIDGVGEWTTTTIYKAKGNEFELLKEQKYPNSLGLLYSAFTQFLGFKVNDGEYKMMGLAPYGSRESEAYQSFYAKISDDLAKVYEDGGIKLNIKYFDFMKGQSMVNVKKWESLLGMSMRNSKDELEQKHCDLALAAQDFTANAILKLTSHAKEITGLENFCFSGGVAYNCAANGQLIGKGIFNQVHIPPAVGDSGSAIGAALAYDAIVNGRKRAFQSELKNNISFLGPECSNNELISFFRKKGISYEKLQDNLFTEVAKMIHQGEIIGWFQGRMEFGARALGARSILASPLLDGMQSKVNLKIKYRESFRPFALMILEEDLNEFYGLDISSPYMAIIAQLLPEFRRKLPADFESLSLIEKCNFNNSQFPAITHVDYSTRIQTVDKESNHLTWRLLKEMKKISGYGMLLNTSFNVKDEPIVCSIEDAFVCFENTEMDRLVANDMIVTKHND